MGDALKHNQAILTVLKYTGKTLAMQQTQLVTRTMQTLNLATSIAKQKCKQSSKEQARRHQWDWCYPEQAKQNTENR